MGDSLLTVMKMREQLFSFNGSRNQLKAMIKLLKEYNLEDKKIMEFSELDKIVFQNIKKVARRI